MQSGVSISTMESCIDVKYGLYNFGGERELARTSLKYILTDMNDIRTKYIKLGFHLSEFMRCKYYQDFGYPTMEEFSAVNLGMDKGSISRCINVFEVFCQKQSNGNRSMFLDARYSNYSYSQLCEMVSMSDDDRRMIKPDMTIKQIREKKKELKNKSVAIKEESDNIPVATSQLTNNGDRIRNMTNEELAYFLISIHEPDDTTIIIDKIEFFDECELLDWLNEEV